MKTDNWQRTEEVLDQALEIDPGRRQDFLDKIGETEPEISREVESLLGCEGGAEGFLQSHAISYSDGLIDDTTSALVGKIVGRYMVVNELGSGGMGSVFLAERTDGEFRQKVALKIVRPGLDTADVRRRFLDERQILANLEHPNIARLIDGGTTDDGLPFFAMEFVEGVPITEYCKTRRLSIAECLILFQKICGAVALAHRNLVIHRDLKPSNIFVTADGMPKLLDFGIAKLLDGPVSASQTLTNVRAFTPNYASPEQISGGAITTASDVYSLGVLLYEMLTGDLPHKTNTGGTNGALRENYDNEPISPRRIAGKKLNADLENIILFALRKEAGRRYATVEQFSEDLSRYQAGLPVNARADSTVYRVSKFVSRNKIGTAAAALFILSLLAGIAATAWQARSARQQRDRAQAEQIKAVQINKFLQEMLSYSNQSWFSPVNTGKNRNITINEMLDEVAPKVETEFADQPEVQAQVWRTLATVYASQLRNEPAEKYTRAALDIYRQINGESNVETTRTAVLLTTVLYNLQKSQEAGQLLDQTVPFVRERYDAEPNDENAKDLALALNNVGLIKIISGDFQTGKTVLREALGLALSANLSGNERGLMSLIKLNLGAALLRLGEIAESENVLREGVIEFKELPGNARMETGMALTLLGECLSAQNKFDEAVSALTDGEKVYLQTVDGPNYYLNYNLHQQSNAFYLMGDYQKAEEAANRSVEILNKLSPVPKQNHAQTWLMLGKILIKTNRLRQGQKYLKQALEIYQLEPDKNSRQLIEIKILLANII